MVPLLGNKVSSGHTNVVSHMISEATWLLQRGSRKRYCIVSLQDGGPPPSRPPLRSLFPTDISRNIHLTAYLEEVLANVGPIPSR